MKTKYDEYYLSIRLSHLLGHSSVGAVVRGPHCLFVVQDIRQWKKGEILHYVQQVKAALGITKALHYPPLNKDAFLPATIFPRWTRCTKCDTLHYAPWWQRDERYQQKLSELKCKKCQGLLQQVNWVLVHSAGYLNDVDWHYFAHRNGTLEQKQCGRTSVPHLVLTQKRNTLLEVKCDICHASASVNLNEFGEGKNYLAFKGHQQPWLKENAQSEESAYIIEVNDTRLHNPISERALVIPPESRIKKGSIVDRLALMTERLKRLDECRTEKQRGRELSLLAREFQCEKIDIQKALAQINSNTNYVVEPITPDQLFEREYQAFLEELVDLSDEEDFVPYNLTSEWKKLLNDLQLNSLPHKLVNLVDQVIAVQRLKEIWVLKGFTRPLTEKPTVLPPDITGETDWLPALELYGEGLFITFNQTILEKWSKNQAVIDRTLTTRHHFHHSGIDPILSNFDDKGMEVTPTFLFLHAFAHKMIKELESLAGYPAASLRERIYSSTRTDSPMAGILIYTSTPDITGTLGGLSEQAKAKNLIKLLARVFENANWCSLDPICAESEGQGMFQLNRAACHSCELLPETSCGYSNLLLDRIFICGNDKMPSLLEEIL